MLDVLAPLGITTINMPLTPEKVWALRTAFYRSLGETDPFDVRALEEPVSQ